ncbi:IS200/IS605 family element transposase accessory protein TnpB [Hydrogenophaga sp. D2P1]|uniref:IS200/IS605 family element transposase accessory protein TnpB n=1 Tax=Hydrogenophaga aromaticivorans TaxID=2610898 RepID=A0A7Y8GXW2_9BURK|nr:RNA-guided endonuclease TnpB family protein [Hydrogenophaga aromaticivorans]NWF46194.1 IS200/IS605 family element transposase accessory protein TnpB [Hydrogenophaga aromaticivorans]
MLLVYRYRVKSLNGLLNRQAKAVNFVWNYCNDRQKDALRFGRRWHSGFDLNKLTTGSSKELGLHAGTINAVCEQYAKSRSAKKRPFLRYRGKKSLGWVPLKGRDLKREGDAFRFASNTFRVFNSRALPEGKIKDGTNFSRDSRGNWFLNVVIDVAVDAQSVPAARAPVKGVGIDLGLKSFAALSTGEVIDNPRHFRQLEDQLGRAQRARKKRQATKIHARVVSARRDFLHKLSNRLVREFDYIAVGNVSAAKLARTSMAKSVLDASWSSFRSMLAYKALRHGAWFEEVNESFSSQVCSSCGALPDSRPRGIADLGIRQWVCSGCGVSHDRDTNAALNILARHGHVSPGEGIPVL